MNKKLWIFFLVFFSLLITVLSIAMLKYRVYKEELAGEISVILGQLTSARSIKIASKEGVVSNQRLPDGYGALGKVVECGDRSNFVNVSIGHRFPEAEIRATCMFEHAKGTIYMSLRRVRGVWFVSAVHVAVDSSNGYIDGNKSLADPN